MLWCALFVAACGVVDGSLEDGSSLDTGNLDIHDASGDSGCEETSSCENPFQGILGQLWERGIIFEPASMDPETPEGHDEPLCVVQDAIWLYPVIDGVEWRRSNSEEAQSMLTSAELALALVLASELLAAQGIDRVLYSGAYGCNLIAGTTTVSSHGLGRAIDVVGFQSTIGQTITYGDHWELDTEDPTTPEGEFLYIATVSLFEPGPFNVVLTPNYSPIYESSAHFEVNLSFTFFK
jgi:hypothetical protein